MTSDASQRNASVGTTMRIIRLLRLCLVIGLIATSIAATLAYTLYRTRTDTLAAAESSARREAARAARAIDAELAYIKSVVGGLVEEPSTVRSSARELAGKLEQLMHDSPAIHSVGVAFAPHSFSAQRRLYAPSYVREGGAVEFRALEDSHDYTQPDVEWYAKAMSDGSAWVAPTPHGLLNTRVVGYSESFQRAASGDQEHIKGVVFAFISLESLAEEVKALDVGSTGWGFVVSKEGSIIIHPNELLMRERMNIFELATAEDDEEMLAAAKQATAGQSGVLEMENRTTGQSSWFAYEPIPATDWSMVVVRIKDEVGGMDQDRLRRSVIWVSVVAILGLICLGLWYAVGLYRKNERKTTLWVLVGFSSVALVAGMAAIRHVTYNQPTHDEREKVELVDRTGLQSFLNSYATAQDGRTPHYVPSGIFVRELKFVGSRELFVKGLLWQRFERQPPEGFKPGFNLPDAVDLSVTEAYRRVESDATKIGWDFQATVRQDMSLSRFPFDHEILSIRLLSQSFDEGTMLVPDLQSYSVTNPSALPGLDENLVLSGWYLARSFFDYKFTKYNTDFGLTTTIAGEPTPELHFNISAKRNLVDAAVGYGIPLVVVLAMLFAIIATATKDKAESELAGFSPSAVMRICSAFFFVVLLAHIQLRQTTQVHEIVFLEYIYFTVYLALLLTSIHSFLFLLQRYNVPFVEYENSLFIKLLFWPALLGLQFLITAVFFY